MKVFHMCIAYDEHRNVVENYFCRDPELNYFCSSDHDYRFVVPSNEQGTASVDKAFSELIKCVKEELNLE